MTHREKKNGIRSQKARNPDRAKKNVVTDIGKTNDSRQEKKDKGIQKTEMSLSEKKAENEKINGDKRGEALHRKQE